MSLVHCPLTGAHTLLAFNVTHSLAHSPVGQREWLHFLLRASKDLPGLWRTLHCQGLAGFWKESVCWCLEGRDSHLLAGS